MMSGTGIIAQISMSLSRMEFPTVFKWNFSVLRDAGWYFAFYTNFNRIFCKHTVETLIRHRILRHLLCVCAVCLRPTKRTLG